MAVAAMKQPPPHAQPTSPNSNPLSQPPPPLSSDNSYFFRLSPPTRVNSVNPRSQRLPIAHAGSNSSPPWGSGSHSGVVGGGVAQTRREASGASLLALDDSSDAATTTTTMLRFSGREQATGATPVDVAVARATAPSPVAATSMLLGNSATATTASSGGGTSTTTTTTTAAAAALASQLKRFFWSSSGGSTRKQAGGIGSSHYKSSSTPSSTWLLLGLPEAGATSLIYRLKLHDFIPTVPTNATVYESFKLRFTCLRHKFTHGGLPPLVSSEQISCFENCQLVERKVRTIDVGRLQRYAKRKTGVSMSHSARRPSFNPTPPSTTNNNYTTTTTTTSAFFADRSTLNSGEGSALSSSRGGGGLTPTPLLGTQLSPQTVPARTLFSAAHLADALAIAVRRHINNASALVLLIDSTQVTENTLDFWRLQLRWMLPDTPRVAVVLTKADVHVTPACAVTGEALGLPMDQYLSRWNIFLVSSKTGSGITQLTGWLLFPPQAVVSPAYEERERKLALLNCPGISNDEDDVAAAAAAAAGVEMAERQSGKRRPIADQRPRHHQQQYHRTSRPGEKRNVSPGDHNGGRTNSILMSSDHSDAKSSDGIHPDVLGKNTAADLREDMNDEYRDDDDDDAEDDEDGCNCRFALIPNGFDLDRFNFELAEAARLQGCSSSKWSPSSSSFYSPWSALFPRSAQPQQRNGLVSASPQSPSPTAAAASLLHDNQKATLLLQEQQQQQQPSPSILGKRNAFDYH